MVAELGVDACDEDFHYLNVGGTLFACFDNNNFLNYKRM